MDLTSGLPLPQAHYAIRWSTDYAATQIDVSMREIANPDNLQRSRLFAQDGESDLEFARRLANAIAQHAHPE